MLKLSEIWIYPIKSLGGISLQQSQVTDRGLEFDRRWLLVDENGLFITQRGYPQLALFQLEINGGILKIYHKEKQESILISLFPSFSKEKQLIEVQVWDDIMNAFEISCEVSDWFGKILGFSVRLVFMPDESLRKVASDYAISPNDVTSFSDGFPFLIIGQSSLDDLNSRIKESVSIRRFRPNFVFTGGDAYEEETWAAFRIGEVPLYGVKPCSRCLMTLIDPDTGVVSGKEPLRTLSRYKKIGDKVIFGQNVIAQDKGNLIIGDLIDIQKYRPT